MKIKIKSPKKALLFFLFLLIIPITIHAQSTIVMEKRANMFYSAEEYEFALLIYDSLLRKDPLNLEFLKKSGYSSLYSYNTPKAISRFKKCYNLNPADTSMLFQLGSAYDQLNKYDSSLFFFNKYLDVVPDDKHALSRKAIIFLGVPEYIDSAIELSGHISRIYPRYAPGYYIRSMALLNNSQTVDAIFIAQEGLRIDSGYSLLHLPLGLGFYYQHDFENAYYHFSQGMKKSDNPRFINHAVQARLLMNTPSGYLDNQNSLVYPASIQPITPEQINNSKDTDKPKNHFSYRNLLRDFNDLPMDFGLHQFYMLYTGFKDDPSFYTQGMEKEKLPGLESKNDYREYIKTAENYLLRYPVDFPVYLELASVCKKMGLNDKYYLNLFRYNGFLNSIIASGSGKTENDPIRLTYLSHSKNLIAEMDLSIVKQEVIERENSVLLKTTAENLYGDIQMIYFDISIPSDRNKKLERRKLSPGQ